MIFSCSAFFPFQDINDDDFIRLFNCSKRSQISSKWLNAFCDNVNNVHLTFVDNCLASNSLCHYIDSDFVHIFCFQNNQSNSTNFTSVCLNVRSFVNKEHYNLFESWIQSLKFLPDIIAINETWEKKSSLGQFRNLQHYDYISNFRPNLTGGGVALYIKKTINYTLRNGLTQMNEGIFESLFIDIQLGNDKITCGTIYRAPKQDRFSNNQFKTQLKNALSTLNVSKNKAYIMGDLNYDLLQDSHTFTDDFVDIMYDHSFYPIINKPTRITQSSSTCIDHIWTNIHDKSSSSAIITHKIADHLPAVIQSTKITNIKTALPYTRNFSKRNCTLFNEALSDIDPSDILHHTSVDNAMNSFMQQYSTLFNSHFPLKKKLNKNFSNGWFTNELNKLLKKKDRMYKKYIKNKLPANHQNYNVARNTYFRKVAIEKQNYFKNLFTKHKNDIKKTWHSINLLLGKEQKQSSCKIISAEGKDLTEPVEIANNFNNYFSTVAENLVKKIPRSNTNPSSFLGPNLSNSFYLYPTTPQKIQKIISSLQTKSSAGTDEIPAFLLKSLPINVILILTNIFNLSLSTGTFISVIVSAKRSTFYTKQSQYTATTKFGAF